MSDLNHTNYVARDQSRVSDTVQAWKNSLLDLSAQNSLIALPQNGTVDMSAPNEVFDPLVRRKKTLNYWDINNKEVDRAILRDSGNYAARTNAITSFKGLHNQAVALLTGQDINVLFVAFGILNWVDPSTGETVRSPLLLVPIALEPHAAGTGYAITAMEEPVEVNPVLKLRLAASDINFILPPSPDERYLIPTSYFGTVSTAIEGREGWSVEERTVLGRFPLLKLRLYEDLLAQEERALSHPLIAALAGQKEALTELPAVSMPNLSDLERDDAAESQYLLLDADPAQERAIVSAARGQSFVLQGPPGTGKTQTIANIIGECAAAGKSVLLVSGRMASLDAVHQRLSDKGLGDLCLLAHSLKTSKRGILQQLEQTLTTPVRATGGVAVRTARQKERDEMKTFRSSLNEFTDALHTVRSPLNLSVYDAVGHAANADAELGRLGIAPVSFSVREIKDVTPSDLARMETFVGELTENATLQEAGDSTIWADAFVDATRNDLGKAVERTLRTLEGQVKRVNHAAQALAPLSGLEAAACLLETRFALRVSEELLTTTTPLEEKWLRGGEDLQLLRNKAAEFSERNATLKKEREELLRRWQEDVFDIPHAALMHRLDEDHNEALSAFLGEEWRDRVAADFERILAALDGVAQDGRVLTERLAYLAEKSGLPLDGSLEARQRFLKIARLAIDLPNPCVGWFTPSAADRLLPLLNESRQQWERYRKGTEQLFTVYSEDILDLNHTELLQSLEAQKGGLARLISTFGNKVAVTMRGVTRPGASTKDRDMEADLILASEMKELRRWCQQSTERLVNAFGSYYAGTETNWDQLRAMLDKAATLCAEFDDNRVPAPLIALMLVGDSDLKQFEAVFLQVNALLGHLREVWEKLVEVAVSPDALPDPLTPLETLTIWCEERRNAVFDFQEAYRMALQYRLKDDKDPAALPVPAGEVINDLTDARRIAHSRVSLDLEMEQIGGIYGSGYKGKDTDWATIDTGLESAQRICELFEGIGGVPQNLVTKLGGTIASLNKEELQMVVQMLQEEIGLMEPVMVSLGEIFKPEYLRIAAESEEKTPVEATSFETLIAWITDRLAATGELDASLKVQSVRDGCVALRLDTFFDAVSTRVASLAKDALLALFRSGFYRAWAEAYLSDVPGLMPFSGGAHEAKIDRFRELDRRQMDSVPGLIRELVRVRSPKNYPDEVKTLKGQLARRRTGEVRRLLSEIPNLVFALKPIVMMNPLSVRLFLDADALRFDVVLFDDASQIATEDAIGAILRGNQVIIAGDPQQIPPLALLVESEKPFESILDAAKVVADKTSEHFGSHALRWHYRSRNEGLIAFSRRYFYPELVSFPSAGVDSAIDYVGTTPDAEGADTEGPVKVIDAVLSYAKENPEHSIGVVALDDASYERITDEIARRKADDPEFRLPHEDEEDGEGFFLKTLENVQGDERDMVVLYIGNDPKHCKPLSSFGGERLLNVAITRARCRMVIVSAFPYDAPIPGTEVEFRGILLLRSFLRYAREGVGKTDLTDDPAQSLLIPGTRMAEVPAPSELESVVEERLAKKGYEVRRQVGLSEYRVDLAIVNPANPNQYLLGIEFDGPMYATGETARHRDRLRIDMLQDRGWNLHRIWALDWVENPEREMKRLEAAITAAQKGGVPKVRTKARRVKKEKEVEVAA